jgi:hypothetical protein
MDVSSEAQVMLWIALRLKLVGIAVARPRELRDLVALLHA